MCIGSLICRCLQWVEAYLYMYILVVDVIYSTVQYSVLANGTIDLCGRAKIQFFKYGHEGSLWYC